MTNAKTLLLLAALGLYACQPEKVSPLAQEAAPEGGKQGAQSTLAAANSTATYQIGGSNYATYDVRNYLNGGAWNKENIKLAIGDYHLNPGKVNAQIRDMHNRGQRKIALPLWFSKFGGNEPGDRTKHLVRINGGRLSAQHQQNLVNVMRQIRNAGYNEVTLRFMHQWLSYPSGWANGWDEALYQTNWNFIHNTVTTVNNTLRNANIKIRYDLGGELGGLPNGQNPQYVRRLWIDYHAAFGNTGHPMFSLAYTKDRLDRHIANLKTAAPPLPSAYAIDTYNDDVAGVLGDIKEVLARHGEAQKNIIIQETYYNDADNFESYIREGTRQNLKIITLYQWQLTRNAPLPHFSVSYTPLYKVPPYLVSAGTGCADQYCLWIKGHFFEQGTARVVLKHPDTWQDLQTYQGSELNIETNSAGTGLITLRLKTQQEKNLLAAKGLRVLVVNPTLNTWSGNTMLLVRK